jgi:hypothetical protein
MASRGGASAALVVVLCSVLVLAIAPHGAAKKPHHLVPAMFVFGDSLVDVGNNNRLANCNLSCKANYAPYGVDLPRNSSTGRGRFSNGYNLADQLGIYIRMRNLDMTLVVCRRGEQSFLKSFLKISTFFSKKQI